MAGGNPIDNRRGSLLIVDDDPDIIVLLSKILQSEGYQINNALSGKEALERVRQEEPSVILLDYMMPDINGLTVLKKITKTHPTTQVIIITGRGDEQSAATLMRSGAMDYITKPFESGRIIDAVSNALAYREKEIRRLQSEAQQKEASVRLQEEKKRLKKAVQEKTSELAAKTKKLETANRQLIQINLALQGKNEDISLLEHIYHEMFDQAGDGIIKTDLAGNILMGNKMAVKILEEKADLGKKNISTYLSPTSKTKIKNLLSSLSSGRVNLEEAELEIPTPWGRKMVNLRAVPLSDKGKVKELEFLMTDITEKVHQEQKIRKLEERAIIAGLSRHLSHILLNALTSAAGYLKKIEENRSDKDINKYFSIINDEMERMEEVVRGYQDYVNIANLNPTSLQEITSFLESFFTSLESGDDREIERIISPISKNIRFRKIDFDKESPTVLIDPYFLGLGLSYLIKGAARYTQKIRKGPVKLLFRSSSEVRRVRLDVITLDVTTPSEVIASMFSPWDHQMVHQTFDYWGVTIANQVAERHNGKLIVSNKAEGTCYSLELPSITR